MRAQMWLSARAFSRGFVQDGGRPLDLSSIPSYERYAALMFCIVKTLTGISGRSYSKIKNDLLQRRRAAAMVRRRRQSQVRHTRRQELSHSGVGDGDGETREDEGEDSDDFFGAGEGHTNWDRLSSCGGLRKPIKAVTAPRTIPSGPSRRAPHQQWLAAQSHANRQQRTFRAQSSRTRPTLTTKSAWTQRRSYQRHLSLPQHPSRRASRLIELRAGYGGSTACTVPV
jgi:hypothetical protein